MSDFDKEEWVAMMEDLLEKKKAGEIAAIFDRLKALEERADKHRIRFQGVYKRLDALKEKLDVLDQLVDEGEEKIVERVERLERCYLVLLDKVAEARSGVLHAMDIWNSGLVPDQDELVPVFDWLNQTFSEPAGRSGATGEGVGEDHE